MYTGAKRISWGGYCLIIWLATHVNKLWTVLVVSEKRSGLKSPLGLYRINVIAEVYAFIWVLHNYTLEKKIGVYICVKYTTSMNSASFLWDR